MSGYAREGKHKGATRKGRAREGREQDMWTGGTHGRKRKECGEARYIGERKDRKKKEGHEISGSDRAKEGKTELR